MLKRFRSLRLAGAALFVSALVTAVPARADVMDCIETVAPPELKQAVENAAKAAQCVGQAASGDAAMIATIGVITALRAGGAFSNTEQCMGMIDSTIGKQVAKALLDSGAANTPLFSPVKSQLQALANGDSSVSFTDLAGQFLPLQQLLSYMTCGCQIAGLDNKVEEIVNAYVGHVTGCAEFLSDAVDLAGDAIESGIDAVGEGITKIIEFAESCFDGSFCGLVDDDGSDCVVHVFPRSKFGNWVPHDINWGAAASCGEWVCAEGGWSKSQVKDGKKWSTCSICNGVWALNDKGTCAPCGGMLSKTISANNMCLKAVTGYPTDDGAHCTTVESPPKCCAPGQVMKPVGWEDKVTCDLMQMAIGGQCTNVEKATTQCVAACPQHQYFDTVTGQCTSCNFDSVPVFTSADSSIAQCKQCPPGLNGFGQNCEPCGPGEVVWTLSPPKKQQKQLGPMAAAPPKKDGAHDAQKQVGPIAAKPSLDPIARPPAPAPGTAMTEIPGGSIGGLVEGGRCMACPQNWYPVYYSDPYKNSLGYCKECPPGTYLEVPKVSQVPVTDPVTGKWLSKPEQPECRPLRCPAGVNPDHPHVCRRPPEVVKPVVPDSPGHKGCAPGMRLVEGACAPPTSAVVPGRRLVCPAGHIPNPARTACVRIGRAPAGGGVITKRPRGSITLPDRRRPPPGVLKSPIGPPPRLLPTLR
jgi:hypothetical protein